MDRVDVDITDTNKDSNDFELYENLKMSDFKQINETPAPRFEEEPYETLKFERAQDGKVETDIKNISLNGVKLKFMIYSMLVSIIVLYIANLALLIFIIAPRDPVPVDGQWASWSSWTSCDVTCGNGTILRTRRCTNPVPTNKGTDCIGESLQSSVCFKDNCQVDGQWASWSSWTSCDVTCGNGTILRTRKCLTIVPTQKGINCIGESLQSSICYKKNCPVDGQWTYWSSWTSCDVTCGKGTNRRTRTCTNPAPTNNGNVCIGESSQSSQCSKNNCPVDGQWTLWSSWTSCDITCGNGTHLRTRRCTNPFPANNGNDCVGDNLQSGQCSGDICQVDGQWTYWSSWTSCDVTCGKGTHLRTRSCTNPVPSNNGNDCIGERLQSSQCSKDKCPAIMSAFSVKHPHNNRYIDRKRKLSFLTTIYQYGSDFNISTGTFTCRIPGVYLFSATLIKKRSSTRVDLVGCYITKNSENLIYLRIDPTDDDTDKGNAAISQSIVIDLDIGDTVYISTCNLEGSSMEHWSSFTAFLLYHKK